MAAHAIDSPPAREPDLRALAALCHHKWAVPVLAMLGETGGAKFVTLVNRLGVSRDALSRTLAALDEQGLAMRNPGYGHPMRPEFLLTPDGERVGPACITLVREIRLLEAERPCAAKWGLPALAMLSLGPMRFGALLAGLAPITPRALTQSLHALEEEDLVGRRVDMQERPPQVTYTVRPGARRLARGSMRLATSLVEPEA